MENEQGQSSTPSQSKRKFWLILLVVIFILVGLIYLVYWLLISQFYETTDDAYVAGNQVQVMAQTSGLVTAILADETDLVIKGQPIVALDKADAEINLENAASQLALTLRQTKQLYYNVLQLRANVMVKQATLEKAQEDLRRRIQLAQTSVISTEELRHIQIDVESAAADLELAKQQLAQAIALIANSNLYHHPQVQLAAIRLRYAYLNLHRTIIYAPETGYVAKRSVQIGQEVSPNNILMIVVPLHQVWVNANFKETQLKNIRLGQRVQLISDAYGSQIIYRGTVAGLSPGTGSAFDLLPPQNATGNWIKIVQRLPVRISVDPNQLAKYPLRIGFSLRVTVNTHNRKGLTLTQTPKQRTLYQTQNYNNQVQDANKLIAQILQSNAKNINYEGMEPSAVLGNMRGISSSTDASKASLLSHTPPLSSVDTPLQPCASCFQDKVAKKKSLPNNCDKKIYQP